MTLLDEVRDILAEEGWTQGQFHDRAGHCIVGGFEAALGVELREDVDFTLIPLLLSDARRRQLEEAGAALLLELDHSLQSLGLIWPNTALQQIFLLLQEENDDDRTTWEDVSVLLKR